MATPTIEQIAFTESELAHLAELRDVLNTVNSPGWARIMKRLDELVDEAKEETLGAGGAPDAHLAALARRWQQREAVLRDVRQYASSCQEEVSELLKRNREISD